MPSFFLDQSEGLLVIIGQYVALILGAVAVSYVAYGSFGSRQISIHDLPTPPRYMTSNRQYKFACTLFVLCCLVVFVAVINRHEQLLPIMTVIAPSAFEQIQGFLGKSGSTFFSTVFAAVFIFYTVLKLDHPLNPFLVVRNLLHSWVSIPQRVKWLVARTVLSLKVPAEGIDNVTANDYGVTASDFQKNRRTVERRWAETCYMHAWLNSMSERADNYLFFEHEAFKWKVISEDVGDMTIRFNQLRNMSQNTGVSRSIDPGDILSSARDMEALHKSLARLASCFIAYNNDSRQDFLDEAKKFGVEIDSSIPSNPLKFIIIYLVGISVTVYVSVMAIAWLHDFINASAELREITITHTERALQWALFGCANWVAPVAFILTLHYLGWRIDRKRPASYLSAYCWGFILSCFISALSLSSIRYLLVGGDFWTLTAKSSKWVLGPALTTVYVLHYLDRRVDPVLPKVNRSDRSTLERVMICFAFAMLVTLITAFPALEITNGDGEWSLQKIQTVIIGTAFLVGFVMANLAQFLPEPEANTPNEVTSPLCWDDPPI